MSEQRAHAARRAARRGLDQHFLRSNRLAADLVRSAGLTRDDLVLEIGAGSGRLTAELAPVAGHVVAVEVDARLARELQARLADNVNVVRANALRFALPDEPFRVVANLPFGPTTAFLRRLLDDPSVPLEQADVIVEWRDALKRATVWPSTLLGATWGAWWTFRVDGASPPVLLAGALGGRRRPRRFSARSATRPDLRQVGVPRVRPARLQARATKRGATAAGAPSRKTCGATRPGRGSVGGAIRLRPKGPLGSRPTRTL